MRRRLTYPKDGEQKLRETIKQLRTQVSRLRKENRLLREELEAAGKSAPPEQPEKTEKVEDPKKSEEKMTRDEWREEFMKKMRPFLKERLEESKNGKKK